jgi:hypothetical protein
MKIHNIIPAPKYASKSAREARYMEANGLARLTVRVAKEDLDTLAEIFPDKTPNALAREAVALYASLYR